MSEGIPNDPRDTFVTLAVSPGFAGCRERLVDSRMVFSMMGEFFSAYADLQLEMSRKLQALAEGSLAKFEQNFVKKAWLGITTGTTSSQLQEIGTANAAWQSILESVLRSATAHQVCGTGVKENVVASMGSFLDQTKENVAKTEAWGGRLMEAMNGYIRKAEEAKTEYHIKSRMCRYQTKILEEAEKQASIGGIARTAILTTSRMNKLKEAAEKARAEETQTAFEYRDALDLATKKQNELYSMRLPRVLLEIQKQVEDRTNRLKGEFEKFLSINQTALPIFEEAFSAPLQTILGINGTIDSRVFVAQNMSSESIPQAFEFVPFDNQSVIPPDAPITKSKVLPPQPKPEITLTALLAEAEQGDKFRSFLEQSNCSGEVSLFDFLRSVGLFRGRKIDIKAVYEQFLTESSPSKLDAPLNLMLPVVNKILQDESNDAVLDELAKFAKDKLESSKGFAGFVEEGKKDVESSKNDGSSAAATSNSNSNNNNNNNNNNNVDAGDVITRPSPPAENPTEGRKEPAPLVPSRLLRETPPAAAKLPATTPSSLPVAVKASPPPTAKAPPPPSVSPPKSPRDFPPPSSSPRPPAALVLLEKADEVHLDEELGGSDDELLNKDASLDDVLFDEN